MKSERNSWIELYRLLAMFMIVGNHFSTQGVLLKATIDTMPIANYVITQLMGLRNVAHRCFWLYAFGITSAVFFLCTAAEFVRQKIAY